MRGSKLTKNPRIHIAKGYAIVTAGGRIQVDTVGQHISFPMQHWTQFDEAKLSKILRVSIVVEMPRERKP